MDIWRQVLFGVVAVVFSFLLLKLWLVNTRIEDGVGPGNRLNCQSVVAIELGTAYTSVAVFINDTINIIPNEHGALRTPSYVAFNEYGEPFVGDEAKVYSTTDPQRVVFDVMRFLGRKEDEFVKGQERFYSFKIGTNRQGDVRLRVTVSDKSVLFTPEEILAHILNKMKTMAEMYLKTPVDCAVVSVPAVFYQAQRHAVKDAGMIADIRIVRLPNTPIITAAGYMNRGSDALTNLGETTILVYYLGAGSCEVSLMTVSSSDIQVSATEGTREIGSEDIIHRIMQYYFSKSNKIWNLMRDGDLAVQRLKREVERAMFEFSTGRHKSTTVEVQNSRGETIVTDEFTRKVFNQLCDEVAKKTMKYARRMLKVAKKEGLRVKDILMLGGGSRINRVKRLIQAEFLAMNVIDGESPGDNNKVRGLALHAAVIQQQINSPVLQDVTTYPIGLFTSKGHNTVIRQFSPLPFEKTVFYGTAEHNQENIGTKFFEGDTPKPGENLMVYSLVVGHLRKGPAGIGRIKIEYELTVDGFLQVDATEVNNKKAVSSLKPKNILRDEEMQSIRARFKELRQKSETYRARVNALHCCYKLLNLCTLLRVCDELDVDSVSRILRGQIRWLQRSGYLDLINFGDRKQALKNSLQKVLKKTVNSFLNIC